MNRGIGYLRNWMTTIKDQKTEFLLIGTRKQQRLILRVVLLLVSTTLIQVYVLEILACGLIVG